MIGVTLVNAAEDNTTYPTVQDNQQYSPENNICDNQYSESISVKNNIKTDNNDINSITDNSYNNNDNLKTNKKDSTSKTIILNSTNFDEYVTDTKFNDKVNPGDVIDIQGFLDGNFPITLNKPLNITSTTNDAYIGHDHRGSSGDSENYILRFIIRPEGSGSNISNIRFHNVHFYTENFAHDIHINNISMDCNAMIGQGRGMISIREGASNVTINNSYFGTPGNPGFSLVVFHYAQNCRFENNTIIGHVRSGNLLYLTTYGGIEDTGETNVTYGNINNTIRYNLINGMDISDFWAICYPFVYEGANLTFENNTILRPKRGVSTQFNNYGTNTINTTIRNNYIPYAERDYITDNNYNDYGTLDSDGVFTLLNKTYYYGFVITAKNITKVINNYGARIWAISPNIHTLISNVNRTDYSFERLYAPNTTVIVNHPVTVFNSTVKQLILHNSSNVTNNFIINNENHTIISDNPSNDTYICDNYLISYNNESIKYGESTISLVNGTLSNNGPDLSNINVLTNDNYYNLFNEDYTLKDDINGTIMALENITNPVIINKPVNLITAHNQFTNYSIFANLTYKREYMDTSNVIMDDFFGHYTYYGGDSKYKYNKIDSPIYLFNNVTFVNGSQNSNITNSIVKNIQINTDNINIKNSSFYGKIILNNSNNNNIENNQLFGNNSTINMINSTKNTIKDNIINNKNEYTIILDENSTLNTIQDNNLETKRVDDENNTIIKGGIDTIINPTDNTIYHNLPYRNVTIDIESDNNVTYKQKNNLTVKITYENQPITEGQVVGLFNGTQIFKENITNGTITTTFTPQSLGDNDIKIWYISPGDVYNTVGVWKKVTARTFNTTLTIEANPVKIGENINVKATLKDEFNRTIDNQTIILKIGQEEYPITTINGSIEYNATTNESCYTPGIKAFFYQSNSYNSSTSNKITLNPGDVKFDIKQKITDNKLTVTINVTDINGIPVTNGRIRFRGYISSNPKLENGMATYEIPIANVTEGMNITANFTNNNAFNTKFESITLNLNPPINPVIIMDNVMAKARQPVTITANITTEDGIPINEGSLTFSTDDYSQTVNVSDGKATVTYTFNKKLNSTLKAVYSTDTGNYYNNTNMTSIIIEANPEDVIINIDPVVGKVNKTITITANVKSLNSTNIPIGIMTFTIDDYQENVEIVNGWALLNHTFMDTLNTSIKVTYTPVDLDCFNANSNITTISITTDDYTLKVDTLNFTTGQTNTIKASIYTNNQITANINKGKVIFKVNGKTLKDANGKVIYAKVFNGTATIDDYEVPDTWNNTTNIQAVYTGIGDLKSIKSDNVLITVKTPKITLMFDDLTSSRNQNLQINIQVTSGQKPINKGKVILKINGKIIKDSNNEVIYSKLTDGIATINYTIPSTMKVNNYTITAIYIDTNYERIEVNKTLQICQLG